MNTANFESIHIMIDAQVWRNLPLHLRLYHAFRQLVISGALVDGAKLPSARALAQQLRLSRDTVENAYSQLQRDGFMTRRQGPGVSPAAGDSAYSGAAQPAAIASPDAHT